MNFLRCSTHRVASANNNNGSENRNEPSKEPEPDPRPSFTDRFVFLPSVPNAYLTGELRKARPNLRPFYNTSVSESIKTSTFAQSLLISPANYGLPFENVFFETVDGVSLHGFLIKRLGDSKKVPTAILLHGNAGNAGDNLPWIYTVFAAIPLNVFVFDYRGYGFSEGSPTEGGVYIDAQAAFDYVYSRTDLDRRKIVVIGQSLGGAIAVDLASRLEYRERIAALVVESTFSSLANLWSDYTSFWALKPLRCFVPYLAPKFATYSKVAGVAVPTLIICGLKDRVIPATHSHCLYHLCGSADKQILNVESGEHLSCFFCYEYLQELSGFMDKYL